MINIHQVHWYQISIPNPAKALRFEPTDRLQASVQAQRLHKTLYNVLNVL